MLATYGIQTQTPHQVEPIEIWSPNNMTKAYEYLGVNKKLGLTGRPARPIGGLGTAKIYRASGMTIVCYPLLFEVSDFYLSQDIALVIDDVKNDLAFLAKCWRLSGRPLFVMLIREDNIRGPNVKQLLNLLAQFKMGEVDGVKVRLGRLQELISSGCVEHLDFLSHSWQPEMEYEFQRFLELDRKSSFRSLTDIPKISMIEIEDKPHIDLNELRRKSTWELAEMVRHTDSVSSQSQLLHVLLDREGPEYRIDDSVVEERLEKLLRRAGSHQQWYVTRFCAATLGKLVDSLAPSITAILVRGKQITLGVFGHEEEVVDKPLSPQEIQDILFTKCLPYDIIQAVLQQEMILNIGKFISTSPDLFKGMLKIRIGWIIHAMKLELNYWEEGGERMLYSKSPHTIKKLLMKVLQCNIEDIDQRSPIWRRQLDGALNRVPPGFYDKVWEILERTPGGLKVAGYHLPQQPTLSDMTMYELNFSLLVEQMLSKIIEPAYRQLMVEAFMVVSTILERNPELEFQRPVNMDVLIKEAFQYFKNDSQPTVEEKEKQDKQENNMASFFNTPSVGRLGTTSYIAKAVVNHLLQGDVRHTYGESCSIS
ncbi:unnamed protein product [Owenia fusiformis]|nr:unnamed protein product [Owenia fusiformis]